MANTLTALFTNSTLSYPTIVMLVAIIVCLVIGFASLLLCHIPLHLILCVCDRKVKPFRKTKKRFIAKNAWFKPKIVSKVYNTCFSVWFMFWTMLIPLTLLSMFNFLPLAASIVIQALIWMCLFLHFGVRSDYRSTIDNKLSNRIKSLDGHLGIESTEAYVSDYRLEKEEDIDEDEDTEPDNNILKRKTKIDMAEEDDIKVVISYEEESGFQWKKIANKIRYYPMDILMGIRKHYIIFVLAIVISIIVPLALVFSTCYACLTYHPESFTSALTRKINPIGVVTTKTAICSWNTICHSYLTVPKDMSTSIIVNFQTYSDHPDQAYVLLSQEGSTYSVKIQATGFLMEKIPFQQRYQYWADLTNLTPSTVYTAEVVVIVNGVQLQSAQRKILKFRTGPSLTSNEAVTFASGGDMEWSSAGIALTQAISNSNPLFAIVGGDIAYENGMPSCFMRMDDWFYNWDKYMTTANNFTVPILSAIGNHEAGGFRQPRSNVGFYFNYFPQQIGLQNISAQNRLPYHEHVFANHMFIVVLDSYVVTPIPGVQTDWLMNTVTNELTSQRANRFAVYHASAYPVIGYNLEDITLNIRNIWAPIFEQNNFKAVFENHYHALQETYPIRNNSRSDTGVIYLGSGAWGLSPRVGLVNSWWVNKAASLCNVYISTCSTTGCDVTTVVYNDASRNTSIFNTLHL
jgi:hypothetical protein